MIFSDRSAVRETFAGRRVAIVGSGPGVLDNPPGLVDGHDVVVRVNNYKTSEQAGRRCDVFFSFFGGSIRKDRDELARDGVRLCIAKCPDAKFMESKWHRDHQKPKGVDFRYIYRERAAWWFCPTYVPTLDWFLGLFADLGDHIPTTGLAAIAEVLAHGPASVYLTGFDFFASGIHNVNERWRPGNPSDPIGHAPELERGWLARRLDRVTMDRRLTEAMA
jgi:hypothetical protein